MQQSNFLTNLLGNSGSSSGGGFGGGSGMGWVGIGQDGLNAMGTLYNGGSWKDAGQSFAGIDKDDSDFNQAWKGTLHGAQRGSAFGPWGALAGGIVGLGASFLDDI